MSTKSLNQCLGKPLPQFVLRHKEMTSSITTLCFMQNNGKEYLICGTDCGQLLLWSLKTYRCETIVNNYNSRVNHLISFENQIICEYKNGVIEVFNHVLNHELNNKLNDKLNDELLVHKSYQKSNVSYCKCFLYSEIISNNIKLLGFVSQTNNKIIEIIDLNSDKSVVNVGVNDSEYGMAFTLFICPLDVIERDIILVLIGYENGFLTLFKANINRNESQFITQLKCFDSIITSMDFNCEKNCGICCSVTDIISVWNLHISEDKSTISLSLKDNLLLRNSGVLSCSIRPDARIFACGGSDSRIRVFAFKSLKPLAVIDTHSQTIECVLYSNKLINKEMHYLLAAASRDRTISLWDIYNDKHL